MSCGMLRQGVSSRAWLHQPLSKTLLVGFCSDQKDRQTFERSGGNLHAGHLIFGTEAIERMHWKRLPDFQRRAPTASDDCPHPDLRDNPLAVR